MKIEHLLLENFGQYGSKRFNLDGQPLVLIYGANETGKTTALNGIRQALFGFPRQSAYLTGKMMSAEAEVTLADGRRVKFVRQKKNTDGFRATLDGKIPLSENEWLALAGGLDLKSYQSLFGFTLEELRSGEKALAHAPIEQALSAGGLGGLAQLQQVQTRINDYLSQSLKKTGTNGTINAKLAEIDAAEKQLESVLTLPADVTGLRTRMTEAQARVAELHHQIQSVRDGLAIWQRRQAALPRAVEYRQVLQSLDQAAIPAALDDDLRMAWNLNSNKLAGVQNALTSEETKLRECQAALAAVPDASFDGQLHQQLVELAERARTITLSRQQLVEIDREVAELEREVSESLRRINIQQPAGQWRKIQIDLAQQADLDSARQSVTAIQTRLADCQLRFDSAEKQLRTHRRPEAVLDSPSALAEFEAALRHARPVIQKADDLAVRVEQMERDPKLLHHEQMLLERTRPMVRPSFLQDFRMATDWKVPSGADILRADQAMVSAERECDRLARQWEQLNKQRADLEREMEQSRAADGLKSLADLQGMWGTRDRVIAEWREELRTPLLASELTAAEVENRLAKLQRLNSQADSAVCDMLAAVDRLAALASQQRQCDSLRIEADKVEAQLTVARLDYARTQSAWESLWKATPIQPASPQEMNGWLEEYRRWQLQQTHLETARAEWKACAAQRGAEWQRLKDCWPKPSVVWNSLAEAEQCLGRLRNELATAQAQEKMVRDLENSHRQAATLKVDLEQELVNARAQLQESTRAIGLPVEWPEAEMPRHLETLKRCQKMATRIDSLKARGATTRAALDGFLQACEQLAAQYALSLEIDRCERCVLEWLDESNRRQQSLQRRSDAEKRLIAQQERAEKLKQQLSDLTQTLESLARSIGATSRTEMQSWIDRAGTVFQLRAKQAQLAGALEVNAGGLPLVEFLRELEQLHPRTVTAESSTLTARLSSYQALASAAEQELGGIARELEFKEQGSAALAAEQRLARLRSELVELSEQWIVHRLAGELLERTIDQFTRDHEPQLIKHTRRFFRELTDDRYCVVEHDSGKHGGFAVRDQQGNAWQPDKLSTGTREQLYLAIRLAFITHFNSHNEPLPVIMDDCFVNFDDTRARIALRTLIHWSESEQTILLSCHWRSVEALAELAPETPVITLGHGGDITTARQLQQRSAMSV